MFTGSIVAIVTPMQAGVAPDTELDFKSLERLIEFHIENGTKGIVAVGTTGESATLTEQEHCDVIEAVVKITKNRVPVIAGTGANSTIEAISLTKCAKKVGADACLLVTPYYNKPTQQGLYEHYKIIAESVDIPQILYNVPGRTACDMLPETVIELSAISNIIGVKEATADLKRVKQIREGATKGFLLLSGDDETTKDFILSGGDGVISVTANVAPKKMSEMCAFASQGKIDEANDIDESIAGLHKELFVESNPIPVKWVLHKMGLIQSGIRLPMTWLAKESESKLLQAMKQANIV
ncbi:MAG: 4-hydroxy-tetrahydrodipicolinate synthase [Legionellales bacterium]|jgi:4-hydroxy-tetrahydrodipicolinate synthase|nr:4-hydroxy-tetrahydrodipicolinate synthase [Legionellales bacterium]|tara:strand:- start:1538 stop:2425 length:888 start_codon:yes stop_codon:yes gene_type:complete